MPPPRVVFDLDDTLYPERAYALSGFRAAERWARDALGIGSLAAEMERLLDAGHLGELFGMALRTCAPDHAPEHLATLRETYRNHTPDIALYDDAAAALAHFAGQGPIGLITDGTLAMQQAKVAALGIAPRFAHIVFTDALGGRSFFKPHPRAYEVMAAALAGEGPLVYVGDNPAKDFLAPNAMGWITVQIERPARIHARATAPEGGAARHRIASLSELAGVLGV